MIRADLEEVDRLIALAGECIDKPENPLARTNATLCQIRHNALVKAAGILKVLPQHLQEKMPDDLPDEPRGGEWS